MNTHTVFREDEGRVWLSRLCGLACGNHGEDSGPRSTRGLAIFSTSLGRFEADDLTATDVALQEDRARIVWNAAGGALQLASVWSICPRTGIVSRNDTLTNRSDEPITIYDCRARFSFPPARYEIYSQDSRWCNENQGAWTALHTGSLALGCVSGRTTEGGTPYLCLREIGARTALAFHVLPRGNWSIEVRARAVMDALPFAVVTLGMADDDMHLVLSPGASLELPGILVQSLPQGEPHLAAPRLHQYVMDRYLASARTELPVVYNTWFDRFEVLEVPRLRRQLDAAKLLGCEVFVVDAGWYGTGRGDWFSQVGDWRERQDTAFEGRMSAFAEEVRVAGLGFGLWMEPERFGPDVPVRKQHPEWFLPEGAPFARIDLENPAAETYMHGEISRLVETYELAWMKIDFNFALGPDPRRAELSGYYEVWYRLLETIRREYPETVFEGCDSGGMRLELVSLTHCDGHFLSDQVHPIDALRIWQGALLRLPPGHLARWLALRATEHAVPARGGSAGKSPVAAITTVAVPCDALWKRSEELDLDFAAAAVMPGLFGLSGDLAGLPENIGKRLARHIRFYKQWRAVIRTSVAHLLTPPRPKDDRRGWAAVQLEHAADGTAMLFVYRLDDPSRTHGFRLRGLDPAGTYEVARHATRTEPPRHYDGAELLDDGVRATLRTRFSAAVFTVRRVG